MTPHSSKVAEERVLARLTARLSGRRAIVQTSNILLPWGLCALNQ